MKYGIFSDVHGNKEAFQEVLKALKEEKVDAYAFIGDAVGYGAEPRQCLQLLKDLVAMQGCVCVSGNHDSTVAGLTGSESYNAFARASIYWTQKQLDEKDIEFLKSMTLVEQTKDFTLVHANLVSPGDWGYIFDIDDAYPNFKIMDDQICFIGHSHKPVVFTAGEMVDYGYKQRIEINGNHKYIINVGSVGQPRDGDPRACYAVYDTDKRLVEIKRVSYDIESAQKKIMDAGLPPLLAERLSLGK